MTLEPPANARLRAEIGQIVAPSDVAAKAPPNVFSVGGRIVEVRSDGESHRIVLADALSTFAFRCQDPLVSSFGPGHLMAVEVECENAEFFARRVLFHRPCDEPHGTSEFKRYAVDGVGRILKARATLLSALRTHFESERFVEVVTPAFAPCPGLDENVDSLASLTIGSREFHLITSPEFHMKRLLTGGMPRIFQFAAAYRAGEEGKNHEPNFTLLEWYRTFSTFEAIQADTEEVLRIAARTLRGTESLSVPSRSGPREIDLAAPFERITVREAFRRFAGVPNARELLLNSKAHYFQVLVDQVEPGLADFERPVFLTDFPVEMGALAQTCRDDETCTERFELYVGGLEVSNGYGELTDASQQQARFLAELSRRKAESAPLYPLPDSLLAALSEGLPPSSGNALGIERLVALCLGLNGIERTIAFPAHRNV